MDKLGKPIKNKLYFYARWTLCEHLLNIETGKQLSKPLHELLYWEIYIRLYQQLWEAVDEHPWQTN